MVHTLKTLRHRYHPFFQLRRFVFGRLLVRIADVPVSIRVGQIPFRIYGRLVTHGVGLAGSIEANPEALFRAFIGEDDIAQFWDVGAKIGLYSWLAKSKSRVPANIVMFEPLPSNAKLIRRTIRQNQLQYVDLRQVALSNTVGIGVLCADELSGTSSFLDPLERTFAERHWSAKAREFAVRTTTIDQEAKTSIPPQLIRINVQKHEAKVLEGGEITLLNHQPIIFIECKHPDLACVRSLRSYDYSLINADNLSYTLDRCTNLVAVPPKYLDSMKRILAKARELASHKDVAHPTIISPVASCNHGAQSDGFQ
jgi:FkbM family methyltransferase